MTNNSQAKHNKQKFVPINIHMQQTDLSSLSNLHFLCAEGNFPNLKDKLEVTWEAPPDKYWTNGHTCAEYILRFSGISGYADTD